MFEQNIFYSCEKWGCEENENYSDLKCWTVYVSFLKIFSDNCIWLHPAIFVD